MAAALFRERVPPARCLIESAGLAAQDGQPIHPLALSVLRAHGVPAPDDPARRFDPARVGRDDLVLTMERRHRQALLALMPDARRRIQLLGTWMDGRDIDDPAGGPIEAFEATFSLIATCVAQWCARDPRFRAEA